MFNCYLKNPIKVVAFDPKHGKNLQTFVFLGDIPATVKNAVYSYKAAIDKIERGQHVGKDQLRKYESVIKEYYGAGWEKKLHLYTSSRGVQKPKHKKRGGNVEYAADSIYGGVETSDDILGIDIAEIDKMLNLETAEEVNEVREIFPTAQNLKEDDFIYTEEEDASNTTGNVAAKQPATSSMLSVDVTGVDFKTRFGRNGGVTFVNDVKIYPEDKLYDVKQKIHMALGIPFYRSHLYWIQNGRPMTTHKLVTSAIYPVDIREIGHGDKQSDTPTQEILGVGIDRKLYNDRNDLKIEANDTFEIVANLSDWYETFYVCDIADFIEPTRSQLVNMVKDKYQLDLFYYGFVVKYWPQLVYEAFIEYILSETALMQKFPDLSIPISHVKKVYNTEAEILDKNYKNVKKIMDLDAGEGRKRIYVAVTHAIATSSLEYKMIVNIRNLFDKIRVNKHIPEIKAYVSHDGKNYLLEKYASGLQTQRVQFPTGMKTGVIIAVKIYGGDVPGASGGAGSAARYMFVNITSAGKYFIKTMWREEEEYQLSDVLAVMKKHADGLFNILNAMGKYIFVMDPNGRGFPLLTENTVKYQSVNVSILWKTVLTIGAYRFVKSLWDPYVKAGIMSAHGIAQMESTNFIFHKAMIEFDTTLIYRVMAAAHIVSTRNQYSRLTNSTIKQKWNQLYGGRIFRMYHRTTDIKFEAINVREEEFKLIYRYVLMFVSKAMCNPKVAQANTEKTFQIGNENVKKLRKLQETDPDLYNLKKFGSNKMYSILCQNPRQPMVYTDDEVDRLSSKDKGKLTKYWNFTLSRETYYGCENPKYPHMSFIIGVHPKNYCLPCCSKKRFTVEDSKKMQINKICMENYEFGKDDKLKEVSSRHVMVYGKNVEPGRISQLPGSAIRDLLFNSLSAAPAASTAASIEQSTAASSAGREYYILGVPQSFPSVRNVGLIYAIAESLSLTPQKLIAEMIEQLNKMSEVFNTLLNGSIKTSFKNMNDLTETMRELFITRRGDFTVTNRMFKNWPELIMELVMIFMRVYVFIFIDDSETGDSTDLYISDAMKSELIYSHSHASVRGGGDMSAGTHANTQTGNKYLLVIKKRNEYYPIFVITPSLYFRTGMPEKKIFYDEDDVVGLLYSLILSNAVAKANIAGEKTINKKITLQVVKDFAAGVGVNAEGAAGGSAGGGYKIEKKYINKRNLCYAVSLMSGERVIYAPVDYSPHISDGIEIDFSLPESGETNVKDMLEYADNINKFIKKKYSVGKNSMNEDMYEYSLVKFTKIHSNNGIVSSATADNIYYFSPIKESEAVELFRAAGGSDDAAPEVVKLNYSYEEINKAISTSAPPAKIDQALLNKSLYNNYLYKLFVIEFVNNVTKETNQHLREVIIKLINSTDFKKNFVQFQEKLNELLDDYPDDKSLLGSQINNFYYGDFDKKKLIADIKSTRYQFDNITINSLKKMRLDDIKKELKAVAGDFTSRESPDVKNGQFPNVYLPCSMETDARAVGENRTTGENRAASDNRTTGETRTRIYCNGRKLMVGDRLNDLVDILAADITNPLKEKYLLSGVFDDNIVEFFNFISLPAEVIAVTKIE